MSEELVPAAQLVFEPGGVDADLQVVFKESMDAFSKDMGPYLMAGMGQMLVVFPVTMLLIFAGYVGGFLGFFAGLFAGMVLTVLGALFGELGATLGALVGALMPFFGFFLVFALLIPLTVLILAPVNASLIRAVAAHQRGEKKLDFQSTFSTATQDLPKVLATAFLMTGITLVALCACYVPVLLVPIVFGFVNSLVVLHRQRPMTSVMANIRHFRAHANTHLMMGLLQLLAGMFAGFLPIIGPMFAVDMHVRAHRKLFGDGADPVYSA